ncbi:MAG: NADH-quinone oxidoreductase subunit N [Fimbriimonadaceae bacterium]
MDPQFKFPVPEIDLLAVLPILIVILTGIIAMIVELARPAKNNNMVVAVSLIGLVAAGIAAGAQLAWPEKEALANMVVQDRFGGVMQLLLIVGCSLTFLFSEGYMREKRIPFGEFYPLALWSTAGAMIMATSNNLLVIFIGLEILSIALYVLAGLSRQEEKSEESALKYFLLGAFASAFLLYGIAMFYGATGSLHLSALPQVWAAGEPFTRGLLLFGLGFMLIGLGFKAAFVPFHQWTPDVYQGAPTNVTAFMAAISKVGAIAALWRVLEAAIPMKDLWMPALFWIAVLSMTVGNVVALLQKDVKRILAYSSIAHAGYILVAILAHVEDPTRVGIGAVSYYLLAYSLMTIGSFAIISMTAKNGKETTRLEDLNGLFVRAPGAAIALVIFMMSLIGIPPTAGFIGKYMIFQDALSAGMTALALVLAVNSAISIYYYIGIAYAAFVVEKPSEAPLAKPNAGLISTTMICAAGLVLAAVLTYPLMNWMAPGPTPQSGLSLRERGERPFNAPRPGSAAYEAGWRLYAPLNLLPQSDFPLPPAPSPFAGTRHPENGEGEVRNPISKIGTPNSR